MGKYFGTDGFRGEANVQLRPEHAFKIGRFLGWYFGREHQDRMANIVIGKDTRRSSYMFEDALSSGITASGSNAYLMHVTTTPSVSYAVRTEDFDCGIMISASHNPYYDNGIKILNGFGQKISAEVEDLLEAYIDKLDGRKKDAPAGTCTLSAEDIKRVKGLGFLQHVGTNKFNGRIITRNGRITDEECRVISEAAKLYGDGYMMFTTRLTVEVSGIDYENIEPFRQYVAKAGLETGGTGSKVRPVVSCKGTTCQYGLYDTYALSEELHEKFYKGYTDVALPHKFKIACGGCPNNCVKPNLNDLGIIGARVPQVDTDKCRGCKKCQIEAACPVKVAKVVDGKVTIDPSLCNKCGRCVGKCPFHAVDNGTYGWRIYIGGRWGKRVAAGQMLNKVFTDKQEVIDVVEKAILLFRSEGISGERFADTINRIGFEKAEAMLLSDDLLQRKNEILGLDVVGGASC